MPKEKQITRWQELTSQQRATAIVFLQACDHEGPEKYLKASRATGWPVAVLRQVESLERGEFEDPDEHVKRLVSTVQGIPEPPPELLNKADKRIFFTPDNNMTAWMIKTFVAKESILYNKDHKHLKNDPPAVLWTNQPNFRGGQMVGGTASMPKQAKGDMWSVMQRHRQMMDWFGYVPEFLITLSAPLWDEAHFAKRFARLEHEMSHCGHKRNSKTKEFMFNRKTGKPIYYLRPHDVELFHVEVERYGVESAAGGTERLFEVAKYGPTVTKEQIVQACGSCR